MAGKLIDGDGVISIRNWVNDNIKVTPNPTIPSGTTPTTLTSIKIGNNYYTIPSGGGGGSGYVPYTGATNDVDLGTHTLNANYLAITSNPSDLTNVTILSKTYIQYIRTVNNVPKIATFHFPDKIGDPTFAMLSDIKIYWHTITITEGSYSASFSFQSTSATVLNSISALNSYFATEKYLSGNYYEPNTSSQFGIPYNYMISSVCKGSGTNASKFSVNYKAAIDSLNQAHYFSTSATVSDVVEEA